MKKRAFVREIKFTRLAQGQFSRVRNVVATRLRIDRNIRSKIRGFLLHGMIYRSIRDSLRQYVTITLEKSV